MAGECLAMMDHRPTVCVLVEPAPATYERILEIQRALWAAVADPNGDVPSALILVEHLPVITLGAAARDGDVLASPETLERAGVELVKIDRGGEATYHGPGQMVAYPIVNLRMTGLDVHGYLRLLEDAVIDTLSDYGLKGIRHGPSTGSGHGLAGVWVGDRKICSIGIAVRRWVTYHGLALNVAPNLSHFSLIKPCGLDAARITSMQALLGRTLDFAEVKRALTSHLCSRLSLEILPAEEAVPMVSRILPELAAETDRAA